MSFEGKINFNGLEIDLKNKINQLEPVLLDVNRQNARRIEREARSIAPTETGALDRSIDTEYDWDYIDVFVDSASEAGDYAEFIHNKTEFIYKAVEDNEDELEKDITEALNRVFK